VAVSPTGADAGNVFVADSGSGNVSVINPAGTVTATIGIGANTEPQAVAVNPTGTDVFVANESSGTVSVINTATNSVIATITVGAFAEPNAVAVGDSF